MAGRPSIVSDYVSIILRTIEKTQNDPARLRSLVYDVARLSLGKHVLLTYHQIGSAGLQQHVSDLETAINHAEDIAQKQIADLSKIEASQKQSARTNRGFVEESARANRGFVEESARANRGYIEERGFTRTGRRFIAQRTFTRAKGCCD
jgi:hypothetical protein